MIVPRLMASSIGKRVSPGTWNTKRRNEIRPSLESQTKEKMGSAYPTVLDGLVPALAVLTDADNNVEAVVASVKALAVALRAVADERESVIFEIVLELR